MNTPYAPPTSPIERRIAEIWEQLLGISGIGVDDNFIRDLGGQSLLGTQILSRVREAFAVQITLRDFFAAPTIRSLAAACTAGGGEPPAVAVPPLVAVRRADYVAELRS
jgi:acyl carrier protein